MGLSFLNPWFWLGALAIAAPIWLHLRRKKETNLLLFSAVQFLDDQPEPRKSPLRLRELLLFAIRSLALLALVAAFAWPYLRGADTVPIKESRVYILDNTLSHQANNGFQNDRDRIVSELNRLPANIQVAVIELTSAPRVLVSFGEEREAVKQRVKSLQPSFQRGSYLAAFRQANSLLANSLGDQKRIVFLGDNQENQWNENVNTPPFLQNIQIDLPRTTAPLSPNLSLSEPRAQRVFLGDKSLVNFTVKLTHVGEARSAGFRLLSNGQAIVNRAVDLDKQPENILLQAQWEADPGQWLRGEAALEGVPDALAADNKVFFSLPPVIEGKVALLAQSHYLRLALSQDIMRGQWATRFLEPSRLSDELAKNEDAEVLCLESNYLQSRDARTLLWRYLTNGRGVILLVNRITPTISGYLRELGFEADGVITNPTDRPGHFQFIFSNHPIFHPFTSPEYGNLSDIKIYKYARLRAAQALPLVFSESGAGLFFQGNKQPGKLFVMAFGLDREHTSWPVHQTFVPFLDLALQSARAEDPSPTAFEPGEMSVIQLPPGSSARGVVLQDESHELARAQIEQGRAQVRLPDKPGLYTLSFDDTSRIDRILSVNPPPRESQLRYAAGSDVIKMWSVNHPTERAKFIQAPQRPRISRAAILQQRYWWWMVLGGMTALLLEMILAEMKGMHTK